MIVDLKYTRQGCFFISNGHLIMLCQYWLYDLYYILMFRAQMHSSLM